MKSLNITALIMGSFFFFGGHADTPRLNFNAKLTGAERRPAVLTDTRGRFWIKFNKKETKARFYLRVKKGVAITQVNLHCHDTRLNDPIAASLFGFIPGGFNVNGSLARFTLTDENIVALDSDCGITSLSDLRNAMEKGRIYLKVNSVANPSGEVQGQVSYFGKDTDGDGIRDTRDPDIDGDGIVNDADPTPFGAFKSSPPPPQTPPRIVTFHFGDDGGGALSCNGKQVEVIEGKPPTCQFDEAGQIIIMRAAWSSTAVLRNDNTRTGRCRDSLIPTANVKDDYNLTPTCVPDNDPPPPPRKDATGVKLLEEWFTDLPWHQKLSTKDSNLIDIPFVLPFEAISPTLCPSATTDIDKSRCMLRYGIVSVMGMHRTDTLYKPEEAPPDQDCQDGNCVEVKFEVQRFHAATNDPLGYQADVFRNDPYDYGPINQRQRIPSRGFAITESTIFAPGLPWYTGHYCAVFKDDVSNAVCYEDYWTTQLIAPAGPGEFWLRDNPALFVPNGTEPDYLKFCQSGQDSCSLFLGKVDWLKAEREPKVVDCSQPSPGNSEQECQDEVNQKTDSVVTQFNSSITQFVDLGRYPWNESPKTKGGLSEAIATNPFIGYYGLKRYGKDGLSGDSLFKGTHYALPKKCTKMTYLGARQGKSEAITALRDCVLNFEIHTSGYHEIWKELYGGTLTDPNVEEISLALEGSNANQYGRTMFMLAGVPEQKIPASYKVLDDGMSIYDKMYGSSLYTQYLPVVNPGDQTQNSKGYRDQYWHNILMSNHMNQTPDHFIRGIRGRTLWHNEYRSEIMYNAVELRSEDIKGTKFEHVLGPVDFPAGFQVANHQSPFHGNTCDSCHIRNGSGIPLMPDGKLPQIHVDRGVRSMRSDFALHHDYTYSNKNLPSMKMVLFDLKDTGEHLEQCRQRSTMPRIFLAG